MHNDPNIPRAKTAGISPQSPSRSLEAYLGMKVIVLKRTDTLRQAALAMAENNVGCVLVANHENRIVGILTDRDLALTVAVVQKNIEAPIYECMAEPIFSVAPEAGVTDVIQEMMKQRVRRIPVITETLHSHGKCLGIVTLDDLIATQAIDMDQACAIVRSQIRKARGVATPHH